ncbi:MAG: ABC transporter substrate-binding protein [Acidimicrobiia bacterium]
MRDLNASPKMSLRVPLILGVLAVLGASCTSTVEPTTSPPTTTRLTVPSTTTTTEPVVDFHGGVAVIGLEEEPFTLNPFIAGDQMPLVRLIAQAWTVGVQDVSGETGELLPEVVTRLPTVDNGGVLVNPDGTMTVTYKIRHDARWADGVPITGADFQFTLDTILDPALPIPKGLYGDIVSSVVAEKTFSYTLAVATIQYETLFDVLLPKHDVGGTNLVAHWNDRTWVSGGPFVLDEWVPGSSITFRRNDAYWKTDPETRNVLPFLDGLEFRIVSEADEGLNAFRRRLIDVIPVAPGASGTALEALGAKVESAGGPVWVHLNFQFGPERLNRNPHTLNEYLAYRQAVMHAIDTQRLTDELFGDRVTPLDSYVSAYNGSLSQAAWSQYGYDPERARALLTSADEERDSDETRRPGDLKVILTVNGSNSDRVRVAELLSEMLADVGIDVVAVPEDSLVFFGETVSDGHWDAAAWAWQASPGLASLVRFHEVFDPGDARGTSNFYRWGTFDSAIQSGASLRYGQILTQMRATVDHNELKGLIREAEQLLADEALFLPLYAEPITAAYWPQAIEGFVMNATSAGFTWNVEWWREPSAG